MFRTSTRVYSFCSANYAGGTYRVLESTSGSRAGDGASPASGPVPDSTTTLDLSPSGAPAQIITIPGSSQMLTDIINGNVATASPATGVKPPAGTSIAGGPGSSDSGSTLSGDGVNQATVGGGGGKGSNGVLVPAVAVVGALVVVVVAVGAAIMTYKSRQQRKELEMANAADEAAAHHDRVELFSAASGNSTLGHIPSVVLELGNRAHRASRLNRSTQAWDNPAFSFT